MRSREHFLRISPYLPVIPRSISQLMGLSKYISLFSYSFSTHSLQCAFGALFLFDRVGLAWSIRLHRTGLSPVSSLAKKYSFLCRPRWTQRTSALISWKELRLFNAPLPPSKEGAKNKDTLGWARLSATCRNFSLHLFGRQVRWKWPKVADQEILHTAHFARKYLFAMLIPSSDKYTHSTYTTPKPQP